MGSEVDMTTEQTVALEFAKYRLKTERKRIIALGLFDSVHLGHRSIIDYTFETAKRLNMTPAILTFDNDFFSALGRSDKLIYTLHERVKILEELGFSNQNILVQPSDVQYMSLSGEDFVRYLKQLNAGAVVCGGDYRFGKGGKWGAADLCKLSRDYGIAPFVCPLIKEWDRKISSSDIREYLGIGEVKLAAHFLGRYFSVSGEVVHDRGVGKSFGLPTANILTDPRKILPADGVYDTRAIIGGKIYPSVTNVGSRPTFGENKGAVETHIIDFDGDIYERELTVIFVERLRGIFKFDSKEELRRQILSDIETVRKNMKRNNI